MTPDPLPNSFFYETHQREEFEARQIKRAQAPLHGGAALELREREEKQKLQDGRMRRDSEDEKRGETENGEIVDGQ
ncbi:hypothetical protein TNCV_5082641 [Trichonephila clavipes]|nr:hypothetical protein TNCV_5082641 [Trichonephila clavipes]